MSLALMLNENEVNPAYIPYIMNEAQALSRLDDYEIDNYADREFLNPEMQEFLSTLPDTGDSVAEGLESGAFTFTLTESMSFAASGGLRRVFGNLRRVVKKELCSIINEMQNEGTLNWPIIIGAVLTAVAAFFGTPVGVIVLPILTVLIAKIIRRGIAAVCPV